MIVTFRPRPRPPEDGISFCKSVARERRCACHMDLFPLWGTINMHNCKYMKVIVSICHVYIYISLSLCLSVYLSIYLSICLSIYHRELM